ncbi:type VI secretion system baseplate subunit TssG [Pigmentibacter sp. JX0631]|uniref:type VI secretion system baseplate subunit TssG n=1 Tax=Pigmentibacter sp. JX0631 TaxID=2976982 RepID=UPI0024687F3C|nr:type VI secretion system baseplate subunit TssG [Pigmentibacter sp. JX0631]WGL60329.1 type VI secretion system baseplate subunit TssG [Pigmentibacter sp. JX0631]
MNKLSKKQKELLKKIPNDYELIPLLNFLRKNFKTNEDNLTYNINYTFSNKINNIHEVILTNENNLSIKVNANNFLGNKGILPDYLLEMANYNKNNSFKEFFNIFFNKIFHQYLEIIKNRFILQNREQYFEIFKHLNLRALNNSFYFKFTSLINNDFQSKTSLKIILENFSKLKVIIENNKGNFYKIPLNRQAQLNSISKLGESSYLGERMVIPSRKIDIIYTLENEEKLEETIKIITSSKMLDIINIFTNKKVCYDLYITFNINKPMTIKNKNNILGINTYLKKFNSKSNKIKLKIFRMIEDEY